MARTKSIDYSRCTLHVSAVSRLELSKYQRVRGVKREKNSVYIAPQSLERDQTKNTTKAKYSRKGQRSKGNLLRTPYNGYTPNDSFRPRWHDHSPSPPYKKEGIPPPFLCRIHLVELLFLCILEYLCICIRVYNAHTVRTAYSLCVANSIVPLVRSVVP